MKRFIADYKHWKATAYENPYELEFSDADHVDIIDFFFMRIEQWFRIRLQELCHHPRYVTIESWGDAESGYESYDGFCLTCGHLMQFDCFH